MRNQNPTHKVVKCQEWDEKRFHPQGCVGPKYDGIRGFRYPGESLLWTRNEKPLYGFEHIVEAYREAKYPHVSDVELWIPGMEFNELSGLIRNHESFPQARAMVIDTPSVAGGLRGRLQARPDFPIETQVIRIPHYKVTSIPQVYHYYKRFVHDKLEGLVYKTFDHEYEDGRPWDWMRLVPIKSADCKVISFYEGKGKMAGMVGGMFVEWHNPYTGKLEVAKVGTMKGIDYAARTNMWWNKEEYIGRVALIKFKNYQPSGQPRQARFSGWRYDK